MQMYIKYRNAVSWDTVRTCCHKVAHVEKARGDMEQNFTYCSKDGEVVTNITEAAIKADKEEKKTAAQRELEAVLEEEYKGVVWKPFQKEVLDLLATKPDPRKIHWYWESEGNIGKSYLSKYICATMPGVILALGKKEDIFNSVKMMYDLDIIPKVVLIDCPRALKALHVSYTAIECLKNGVIKSGKYEGGQFVFRHPHVICFANEEPVKEKLSDDRWVVKNLGGEAWVNGGGAVYELPHQAPDEPEIIELD